MFSSADAEQVTDMMSMMMVMMFCVILVILFFRKGDNAYVVGAVYYLVKELNLFINLVPIAFVFESGFNQGA